MPVSFAPEPEEAAPELTAASRARMRPAAPLNTWLPGTKQHEAMEPGAWQGEVEGYESSGRPVRKRSGSAGGGGCCSRPPQSRVERRPQPGTVAEGRAQPQLAVRPVTPLPRLEPEQEVGPGEDEEGYLTDGDEYLTCSDDEGGGLGGDSVMATSTCCPAEHLGKLSSMVAQYGADAPLPATHTLWRFLCARKYNLAQAGEMYADHLDWRRNSGAIPAAPTAAQTAALDAARLVVEPDRTQAPDDSGRRRFYRLEARDADGGVMICCVLAQWLGLTAAELDESLGAYLLFIEETARIADEHPDPMQRRWTVICDCAGLGPTSVPLKFLRRLNAAFEPNYPERLKRTVMLPIPGFVVSCINGMLSFVDETTRAKFSMVRDAAGLAGACGIPVETLPAQLRAY